MTRSIHATTAPKRVPTTAPRVPWVRASTSAGSTEMSPTRSPPAAMTANESRFRIGTMALSPTGNLVHGMHAASTKATTQIPRPTIVVAVDNQARAAGESPEKSTRHSRNAVKVRLNGNASHSTRDRSVPTNLTSRTGHG